MNFENVRKLLKEHDKIEVGVYIDYLKSIENDKNKDGTKKNKWFPFFKDDVAVSLFKKVLKTGLAIDGDMITIVNKGK